MSLLTNLICLACSFITCLHHCKAVPVSSPPSNPLQVNLPLGSVVGTSTSYSAQRFTIPYAQPPVGSLRFASPQPLTSFNSSGVYDATHLPAACMQNPDSRYNINNVSEDCLYLNVFRPSPASGFLPLKPVLVWVHGGSFISGSSTAPGLDGSFFASQNNIVVITIQYRLGMFGFFSPPGSTDESSTSPSVVQGNQGVRDAIQALSFIKSNIAAFGGDPNAVTLAGQSSGAHLIRSLLNSPSAASLFSRAILHSDPANFGTQTLTTSGTVSQFAMEQTSCSDLACLRGLSASDILDASSATAQSGQGIDPAVAVSVVFRPFIGSLTGPAFEDSPSANGKPVIFTNVENEAGSVIGQMLLPTSANATSAELRAYPVSVSREQLLKQMFNDNRAQTLSSAAQYSMATNTSSFPPGSKVQVYASTNDSLRRNLETVLTQGMFTCATWFNALRYPNAYVALFEKGITYPSNEGNDYCGQDGRVCHENDILVMFSDPSKVAADKARVVREVQARWAAFVKSGNPNTGSYGGWQSAGGAVVKDAKVMRLGVYASGNRGGSMLDTISLQAGQYAGCGQVWGGEVKYDWQLYG